MTLHPALLIEIQHEAHPAEGLTDLAVLPGVHRGLVDLHFLLPDGISVPRARSLINFEARESFGRRVRRICSASRVTVGMIVDVLLRQLNPLLDLAVTASIVDLLLRLSARTFVGSRLNTSAASTSTTRAGSSSSSKRAFALSRSCAIVRCC